MKTCERCQGSSIYPEDEREFHFHHIIPKSIGGDDKDGRVLLCKRCHDVLHFHLLKITWPYILDKTKAIEEIKRFTREFMKNG